MKKAHRILIMAGVALMFGLCLFLLFNTVSDREGGLTKEAATEEESRTENLRRLREQRGGSPIEYAIGVAKTQEQRELLQMELGFMSQTREGALEEANRELAEVEDLLEASGDDSEKARLEARQRVIEKVIKQLEGRTN